MSSDDSNEQLDGQFHLCRDQTSNLRKNELKLILERKHYENRYYKPNRTLEVVLRDDAHKAGFVAVRYNGRVALVLTAPEAPLKTK